MEGYHHVTRDERIRIEVLRNEGVSIRGIAVRLGGEPVLDYLAKLPAELEYPAILVLGKRGFFRLVKGK